MAVSATSQTRIAALSNARVAGTDEFFTILALFALWVFCNPYFAIDRGGLIYAGRALADLDPAGVGQDMMFRLDGQSEFTIFTPLFRVIARAMGVSHAMMAVAAAGVATSFAAAVHFAQRVMPPNARYLAIAFAAALPAYYGGYELFSYAETAVTPRPFAESFVLCGLAALLAGRHLLSLALMAIAFLLHPIMALAGVGVLIVATSLADRRWALCWLSLAGCLAIAALFGGPPFDRLAQTVDPEWRAILVARNPHLFPSLWPADWTGRTATRVATLLIAASLVRAPVRRLFLTTTAVGLAGLAASYVLGDLLSSLIVLQAQTWRMMWLVFAAATFALAICVVELWRRDGISRIVLAFLAMAWAFADFDLPGSIFAGTALVCHYFIEQKNFRPPAWATGVMLGVGGMAVLGGVALGQLAVFKVVASAPEGLLAEAGRTLALQPDYTPIAVIAAIWAVSGAGPLRRALVAPASVVGLALAFMVWDQRTHANQEFDSGQGFEALAEIVAPRAGEVYWIDGLRGNWWWLHRPHWISTVQGAGIVFSRDLAVMYRERALRARTAGLADELLLSPFAQTAGRAPLNIETESLATFCAYPDAPAWIVAPKNDTVRIAPEVERVELESPERKLSASVESGRFVWTETSRYAVIACKKS